MNPLDTPPHPLEIACLLVCVFLLLSVNLEWLA
jgi:hypothetical protein